MQSSTQCNILKVDSGFSVDTQQKSPGKGKKKLREGAIYGSEVLD
jgi:hypothetical protein